MGGAARGMHRVLLSAALSLASSVGVREARATYSIAAVDVSARQMGGAGTSCLGGQDVAVIYKAAPGAGVVLGQAQYSSNTHQRALELLAAGMAPEAVLADVTSPEVDALASVRQYAIVTVTGALAAFTGSATEPWSGDTAISGGGRVASIQGNILTSSNVVSGAASSFSSRACDLAEQLLSALEAGALNGEGDRRCTPALPSDSAFLFVDAMDSGERLVDLRVPSSGAESPLVLLRAQLTEHRRAHPCVPEPAPEQEQVVADSSGCGFGRGRSRSDAAGWLAFGLTALGVGLRRSYGVVSSLKSRSRAALSWAGSSARK